MSAVRFQVPCVVCQIFSSSSDRVMKLVSGGSVINGVYPVFFFLFFLQLNFPDPKVSEMVSFVVLN